MKKPDSLSENGIIYELRCVDLSGSDFRPQIRIVYTLEGAKNAAEFYKKLYESIEIWKVIQSKTCIKKYINKK